jgi:uncharacterized protein YjaG (DUF416 family)
MERNKMTIQEEQNVYYCDVPRFVSGFNIYQQNIVNCCFLEMMYPCYYNLFLETNFGKTELVSEAINLCWEQLHSEHLNDNSLILKRLMSASPNVDKHYGSGKYWSGASYLIRNLRLVLKHQEESLPEISRNYLDAVDQVIMNDCFSDEENKMAWESDLYVREREFVMNLLKKTRGFR